MRKTPQQIADSNNGPEKQTWLAEATPREIQTFIHCTSTDPYSRDYQVARTALDVRISEDAAESAKKMERYTRWLIALTWAIIGLTAFLCIDAYFSHHDIGHENAAIHNDTK